MYPFTTPQAVEYHNRVAHLSTSLPPSPMQAYINRIINPIKLMASSPPPSPPVLPPPASGPESVSGYFRRVALGGAEGPTNLIFVTLIACCITFAVMFRRMSGGYEMRVRALMEAVERKIEEKKKASREEMERVKREKEEEEEDQEEEDDDEEMVHMGWRGLSHCMLVQWCEWFNGETEEMPEGDGWAANAMRCGDDEPVQQRHMCLGCSLCWEEDAPTLDGDEDATHWEQCECEVCRGVIEHETESNQPHWDECQCDTCLEVDQHWDECQCDTCFNVRETTTEHINPSEHANSEDDYVQSGWSDASGSAPEDSLEGEPVEVARSESEEHEWGNPSEVSSEREERGWELKARSGTRCVCGKNCEDKNWDEDVSPECYLGW